MQSATTAANNNNNNKNPTVHHRQQDYYWKRARSLLPLFLLAGFSFLIMINTTLKLSDGEQKNAISRTYVDVVIVGAGAAGIAAARQLRKSGIHSITVLEASHQWGGRMRKMDHFVDYPIDLGASLIHDPKWFRTLMDLAPSTTTTTTSTEEEEQGPRPLPTTAYLDEKQYKGKHGKALLVNSTWYDFFHDHLRPHELGILYNSPVNAIDDYPSTNNALDDEKLIEVTYGFDSTISAKAVIVTVPLSVLKDGDISFTTTPSSSSSETVEELMDDYPGDMWGGFKIVFEFNKTFYPPFMDLEREFRYLYSPSSSSDESFPGDVEFWDYSIVHHHSSRHVLAGHFVGEPAKEFMDLDDENDMVKAILLLLDRKFENYVATRNYIQHRVVNWSKEPYIRGCYVYNAADGSSWRRRRGAQKITDRLYLAGEAFPGQKQEAGWVHSAALSGMDAATKIIHYFEQQKQKQEQ
eukprot:scaffold3267_cov140-Cylindrotheca_fusiformis.AAC.11